ncbi:NAD-binding component of TrK potassium transporter [Tenacibaculum maritimum]|uniref:Trk system potassium uptake protein TrkA n=2 Tax=Tenacibaculum maritimum TaxID=107401 RepID=A0A2H1EBK8_9FLAO|nr:NAD-binding component of TrK potassium transporter [Tenacibaculum maritimum]SFZ83953.1 Potassium uptake protein [Tenacibaculum maritimum NCIMB 2154]CAA0144666.1 NAD-binding component of TrK potassium transporter [Tenacibaculum maritimum]CAA0144912.1 NAD-binding component of TrK potassium transporter [Tenacibaculum maritimum]CAA0152742.1 NAD-binding component of TrK potassium transporter [Tenacibaculum maritimum]
MSFFCTRQTSTLSLLFILILKYMKIIIAGAGDVGFHLAKLLSYESQDTYIIDFNGEKLNHINNHLDVITKKGDATSIRLLKEIGIESADLLLAVTESQNTNFTISVIGKALGVKKTIARINNPEFVKNDEINFQDFGVDFMISPEELAADEIKLLLNQSSFNDTVAFENGVFNVMGTSLSYKSPIVNLTVKEAKDKFSNVDFITIAIKREGIAQTIIPRGDTEYKIKDQVYFSVPNYSIDKLSPIIGKKQIDIKNVMILGGSSIGKKTARNLCKENFKVKLFEKNKDKALTLAEDLRHTLVINGDGRNIELLEEENIREMDAFIAVTGDSETNIMSCLVAKSKGVRKTIALVENMDYINISQTIGIDTLINKKLIAASNIFRHIRKGEILALANLYNIDAEVFEFEVQPNAAVTKKPIKELRFPREAVFGGIIRNGKAIMSFGSKQIQSGDKVIVFCLPEAITTVEELFN